jgi:hypothetical protein
MFGTASIDSVESISANLPLLFAVHCGKPSLLEQKS